MKQSLRNAVTKTLGAIAFLGTVSVSICVVAAPGNINQASQPITNTPLAVSPSSTAPTLPNVISAPPIPKGPSFESNGLKATIDSVSGKSGGSNVSLSLVLQNTSKEKFMVALIGLPMGINDGTSFFADNIGGVPFCAKHDQYNNDYKAQQAAHNKFCLLGDKPELDYGSFAVLDSGSAIPVTIAMHNPNNWSLNLQGKFAFAMTVASFKESDLGASSSLATSNSSAKPASLRFTSIGISSITFENKKPEE
jgi:hypothetical protein